jgi:hypothetical protein
MSKSILKTILKTAQNAASNRIAIITEYLKINGNIYEEKGKCEECHDDIITLTNAMVCRLNDYCTCDGDNCDCNDYVCFRYEWLNINVNKIVAYSVVKE